ncbi:uncharacterized protein LOC131677987 [Topomyia yanbarensis]|uniref:uncharacterized protein LOC131677987 n=1 Tax=Topomyia yanbarensis TaxID=2498891 RepID=UPI00273AA84E|nr:uncharacterized protein LOC131677987 [Topomyia yanbarensis]
MGSLEEACITGFLCRLCSQIHRSVIFIYGSEGNEHELEQKINNYLPVKIAPTDPLPKTVCEICMNKVIEHHGMMEKILETQKKFTRMREEEMLLRQQLNRNNASQQHRQNNTSSNTGGSSSRNTNFNTSTTLQLTSASPASAAAASSNTRSPPAISPNLNRRITRSVFRLYRRLNYDVSDYIVENSSSSSDDDSDSDSADEN